MKVFFGVLVLCFSGSCLGQNFIANGDFSQNVDQWDNSNGYISWVNDGATNPGALEISDNFNNGGSAVTGHMVNIEVQAGVEYEISAATKVMPETEAQGTVVFLQWLDENEQHVGYTDYVYSNQNAAAGTWHNITDRFMPPEGMKYARILLGVTGSSDGSTEYATARWDDIRFEVAGATAFTIVPAHSGSWLDQQQSGHGINVEILEDNQILMFWYTFDQNGRSKWLFGTGSYSGGETTIDAYMASGAMFPPNFDPADVNLTLWGQFYLQFTGCHAGLFKWMPVPNSSYTSGEMNISRLTSIKGTTCSE